MASHLAEQHRLALVTDNPTSEKLAYTLSLRLTSVESSSSPEAQHGVIPPDEQSSKRLALAVSLAELALQDIPISESIPIERLIKFRRRHHGKVDRFRSAIAELANELSTDYPSEEALEQAVADTFANSIRPAVRDLEQALADLRLKAAPDLLQAFAFTTAPVWFGPVEGMLNPLLKAAATGVGASLSATAVANRYAAQRREILAQSPFSLIVAAQRELLTSSRLPLRLLAQKLASS